MNINPRVAAQVGATKNQLSDIKLSGVNQQSPVPAAKQQAQIAAQQVFSAPKGSLFSVTIANTDDDTDESFILFDSCGFAANAGATAQGAHITIKTTFAGGGSNQATGYSNLKALSVGTHLGSVGTAFIFSDESMIQTSNIKIWNGNIENYNSQSLSNYVLMARDTYAHDQKMLVMNTTLYINNFFAITGTIPFGESLTILFNVALVNNW